MRVQMQDANANVMHANADANVETPDKVTVVDRAVWAASPGRRYRGRPKMPLVSGMIPGTVEVSMVPKGGLILT